MKNRRLNSILSVVFFASGLTLFAQPNDKGEGKKPPTAEEAIKQMDTNKDGKLAKDEVKGPLKDDFSKIDADKDGYITLEELKKAPKPEPKKQRD